MDDGCWDEAPVNVGKCEDSNYKERWFFDERDQQCKHFQFCQNTNTRNIFSTRMECVNSCRAMVYRII